MNDRPGREPRIFRGSEFRLREVNDDDVEDEILCNHLTLFHILSSTVGILENPPHTTIVLWVARIEKACDNRPSDIPCFICHRWWSLIYFATRNPNTPQTGDWRGLANPTAMKRFLADSSRAPHCGVQPAARRLFALLPD